MEKKKLNFSVDENLHRALKVTAAKRSCSVTALIIHVLSRTLYYEMEQVNNDANN